MITNYILAPRVFKNIIASYSNYEKKVTELMALRPDLTFDKISDEVTKKFNSSTMAMVSILDSLIITAAEGRKMPWEIDAKSK